VAVAYAELYSHSNFSFLRGASHPEELVRHAFELGYRALALTDRCSLSGVVRGHVEAKACDFAFIVGSELPFESGPRLVALAVNRDGYGNLSSLISRARGRAGKGSFRLLPSDLDDGLPDCLLLWLPDEDADPTTGRWLAERLGGRLWIGVSQLRRGGDRARLERLQRLGQTCAHRWSRSARCPCMWRAVGRCSIP
jgi:error-prone DNA polymerase